MPASGRAVTILACALIIAAGLLAYWNSFAVPFLFDDERSIVTNYSIRRLWPLTSALWAAPKAGVIGRPLVNFSFAINYAAGGLHVWGYHALNLTVHLLASLTLFGVVRRTLLLPVLRERYGGVSTGLALAAALLWAVHPLHTESVTYIVQRAESLMGLCFLLTVYCALRGAEAGGPGSGRWSLAAVAACAMGMSAKLTMITAPLAVLLYDRIFIVESVRDAVRRRPGLYAGLAATWGLLAGLMLLASPTLVGMVRTEITPLAYLATQPGVILHYLRLSLWPTPLCFDYAWPLADSFAAVLLPALPLAALAAAVVWAMRHRPPLGFIGAWFVLTLAPASSVFPVADVAVEHRMYLPLAALVVLAVVGGDAILRRLPAPNRARSVLAAGLVAVLTGTGILATARRNADYHSEIALWGATAEARPSNPRAHTNLGIALARAGKGGEAEASFRQALDVEPTHAAAHGSLALLLAQQGKADEAETHYREALRLKPNSAMAHNNLGTLLARRGDLAEAADHFATAFALRPDQLDAAGNLARALMGLNQPERAREVVTRALRLDPTRADLRDLLTRLDALPSR